jgi:hypothetical protein
MEEKTKQRIYKSQLYGERDSGRNFMIFKLRRLEVQYSIRNAVQSCEERVKN